MNERMEELAIQSGIYGAVDINGHYDNELEVKKFAELIIKECVKIAEDKDMGLDQVSTYIKEHFGIDQ